MTKKYRVEVSESAFADLRSIKAHIAADNQVAADRWLARAERLVAGLATLPFAFEVIPEAKDLSVDYRQKLFGSYRIIYRVEEDRVIIMRIIHAARLLDQSMFFDQATSLTAADQRTGWSAGESRRRSA